MRHSTLLLGICAVLCLATGPSQPGLPPGASGPITAILGSMAREVVPVESELVDTRQQSIHGIRFVTGKRLGRDVVVAKTGWSKVDSAMTATLLIDRFTPSEVIYTGVAGAVDPHLRPGDVVIGRKTACHDMGRMTESGFERGHVDYFPGDARLLRLAQAARQRVELEKVELDEGEWSPRVTEGVIVTGDVFVASAVKRAELRSALGAVAVEMEGAAVAEVCQHLGVPCLVVRSISDRADATASADYRKYRDVAARNSARLVLEILDSLAGEESNQPGPKAD